MSLRTIRNNEATQFAQSQRQSQNDFAQIVWQWVRNRRLYGKKFRREVPIQPYTVDFCCIELRLIIEVDGESHLTENGLERDRIRDEYLKSLGYAILRIHGYDLLRDPSIEYERICNLVKSNSEGP